MIDPKIVNAVRKGKDAYFVMKRFGIPQATAFRLVKRIKDGQLDRKPGSGQPQEYVWNVNDVRRFLLKGPTTSTKTDEQPWTIRNLRGSIKKTLRLNISLDTIRRRLKRSGLKPRFPESARSRLEKHISPTGGRATCLFIGETEIDLHTLATNQASGVDDQLHVLYAVDRRHKLLFHCCRREVTPNDLLAFFKKLLSIYANRFIVCGTRLPLSPAVEKFSEKHQAELCVVKLAR